MKVVITGATGLIGSILTDRLWNQFHSVVLLSRKPPSRNQRHKKGMVRMAAGRWRRMGEGHRRRRRHYQLGRRTDCRQTLERGAESQAALQSN